MKIIVALLGFVFVVLSLKAQVVLLEENFDTGIPSSFVIYNNDGYTPHSSVNEYTNAWISKPDPFDSSNVVASSTSYFDQPKMADRWLITPSISLGNFGNVLSWQACSHDASFAESYLVMISETGTNIEDFTDTLARVVNEDVYWTQHFVNLSEKGFDGKNVHVAFVLKTIDGFKFYLDSVKVVKEDSLNNEHLVKKEFLIYPNPVKDFIKLDTDIDFQSIGIYDIKGELLIENNVKEIDVRSLSKGLYIVKMKCNFGTISKKMIKE